MPMQPWMERPVQGSLAGEQPPRQETGGFWNRLKDYTFSGKPGGFSINPFELYGSEYTPTWAKLAGAGAGIVGLGALGGAAALSGSPMALAATGALGSKAPQVLDWLSGAGKSGLGIVPHWAQIAAPLGYMGYTNRPGTKEPTAGAIPPTTPSVPVPTTEPNLPQPGEGGGAEAPTQPTFFTDEQGIRWIRDEDTGTWSQVDVPTLPRTDTGLTPEQQLGEFEAQRTARIQEIELQMEMQRQMQEASAAQQMTQMYAADPYKYWAQLGAGTPEAVARLTGYQGLSAKELGALSPHERAKYIGELEERYPGQVAPGEEMQHTPLSTPSQQWWGNLLPSEQQQIMGGVNWLGIDPMDWYSMQQRMIPGLGARQLEPAWAR